MEADLLAKIKATTAVSALVSTRVNWSRRPQGEALPAIVLHRIGGMPDVHHGGASGLSVSRVQVDCWGASYGAAKAIARAVQSAITARTFTQGSTRFDVILVDSERDDSSDETTPLFRTSLDLMVHSATAI